MNRSIRFAMMLKVTLNEVIEMNKTEIMDKIQKLSIGDKIQVNDWDKLMKVYAVSDHYVLAYDGCEYTIVSKSPQGYSKNDIKAEDPFCATDWWTLGCPGGYNIESKEWCKKYMNSLETGETQLSERHREAIYKLELST